MFTVLVDLTIHPEHMDEFITGIRANARASLRDEAGCLRFDVHRRRDEPFRFFLHEVYLDEHAFYTEHRAAPHYAAWQRVAQRCVVPGTHHNTFGEPVLMRTDQAATDPATTRQLTD
ncbi:Quinol monooxygenase YgiN [Klenkia soli]|uniref:Quinol monooxygenase YgiN n=1 Tax=Klenkia soli TaxID=1052260 RepID=A0A1H0GNZ5_9ACTN|nr:putative quinol monooxygenase [Klenkia soli]SDO08597.1 Quinol monooxygenase YgiN [Klenkia soli]